MIAKLTFPFLGAYGPQSGITIGEFGDYAETEEAMIHVFREYATQNPTEKIERFDIEADKDLDVLCGDFEIAAYFQAVYKMFNAPVSGCIGDIKYTAKKAEEELWEIDILMPGGTEVHVNGKATACALALIQAHCAR